MKTACITGITGQTGSYLVEYLLNNPNKIRWYSFSINPNPKAMEYCIINKRRAYYAIFKMDYTKTKQKLNYFQDHYML